MTHNELVKITAKRAHLPINQTADAVSAFLAVAADEIRTTGQVSLKGLGKLVRYSQSARVGRNPRTGAEVAIPERQGVKFKRSVTLAL